MARWNARGGIRFFAGRRELIQYFEAYLERFAPNLTWVATCTQVARRIQTLRAFRRAVRVEVSKLEQFVATCLAKERKWDWRRALPIDRNRYFGSVTPIWYRILRWIAKVSSGRGPLRSMKTDMKSTSHRVNKKRAHKTALMQP